MKVAIQNTKQNRKTISKAVISTCLAASVAMLSMPAAAQTNYDAKVNNKPQTEEAMFDSFLATGFYAGAEAGAAFNVLDNINALDNALASLKPRVYVGYQFNQHLAVEAGAARYMSIKIPATKGSVTLDGVDAALVLNAPAPFVYHPAHIGLNLFAKAGFSYQRLAGNTNDHHTKALSAMRILPMAGAGLGLVLTKHVEIDSSISYAFGKDMLGDKNFFPSTAYIAIGAKYRF